MGWSPTRGGSDVGIVWTILIIILIIFLLQALF